MWASVFLICKLGMMAEFVGCLQGKRDERIYEEQCWQPGVILPQGVIRQCLETFLIVQMSVCVCVCVCVYECVGVCECVFTSATGL